MSIEHATSSGVWRGYSVFSKPRRLHNPPARRPDGSFPMIGKKFSNGWKNWPDFSNDWKIFRRFSNDWKKFSGKPQRSQNAQSPQGLREG
ncbi:MAG: hypothetical protein IKO01_08625 [Kiritimatiellae bacterium]|nr:hypothetical protein [Kiritimatiellia bacterium]